jgi:hypothetical protein
MYKSTLVNQKLTRYGLLVREVSEYDQNISKSLRVVVWNMAFIVPYIGNFMIPTDELHHFSEG